MIGDLKNNIIYVSGDDNSSTYEMNLDAIQIPEVANAGLSAMFSENIADSDDDSDPTSCLEQIRLLKTYQ